MDNDGGDEVSGCERGEEEQGTDKGLRRHNNGNTP